MSFWFPEHIVRHNELLSISGDSPYYHVAQDIYEALIPYGGYTPDASNPFITADYADAAIAAGASKAAYGRGSKLGFTVDNALGTNTNGTYSGDFNFASAPKVIVTCRDVRNITDTDAGQSVWNSPIVFSIGFTQEPVSNFNIWIDEYAWLAAGQ